MLVSALSRALADRVMLMDLTIGRKGLLGYLKALGGSNIVKVTPDGSASGSQATVKRLKVICGANTSYLADGEWKVIAQASDIEARLDARATLKALPKRLIQIGVKRAEGERLNNAEKLYLSRMRRKPSEKYHWTTKAEAERIRHLYVDEGLSSTEIARITGKGSSTVQRCLVKLGIQMRNKRKA